MGAKQFLREYFDRTDAKLPWLCRISLLCCCCTVFVGTLGQGDFASILFETVCAGLDEALCRNNFGCCLQSIDLLRLDILKLWQL
jgi:hypothetical protein